MSASDAFVRTLLVEAVDALIAEELALAAAFRSRERPERDLRQGLAYQLYETTLVYLIFKRWLTITDDVLWDGRHSDHTRALIDLQVNASQPTGRLLFEAKWWQSADGSPGSLLADVRKRQGLLAPGDRLFLLAFWYAKDGDDNRELDQRSIERAERELPGKLVHSATFSTRVRDGASPHYFGFGAFEWQRGA